MSTKIKADDILKCFDIIRGLEKQGIEILDWDSQAIEIQFPDGERKRMGRHEAAAQIARLINFNPSRREDE